MEDLARHGFEEILVYVDAATPYELSREENERLQRLRNSHRVSVVAGQADPHVIRALLAQPVASEFVTCDRYRKEMTDPEFGTQLGRLKADKWRRFHIAAGGRLEWEDPLDRRPRVV
jgi:hypothetical protein